MRLAFSFGIAITVAIASIASEPRAGRSAAKTSPRKSPNAFQRVLDRLAARDRATTNDVATLLVRTPPDFARFMLNRLSCQERQTGVREDDFVGAKLLLPQAPPQNIPDLIAVSPFDQCT